MRHLGMLRETDKARNQKAVLLKLSGCEAALRGQLLRRDCKDVPLNFKDIYRSTVRHGISHCNRNGNMDLR